MTESSSDVYDYSWQATQSKLVQSILNDPEQYECAGLRNDVVGKWGGIQAAIANIRRRDGEPGGFVAIYILVDTYYNVGCWPDQEHPSKWATAQLLCEAMRAGIPHHDLYAAIAEVIASAVEPDPSEMVRLYASREVDEQ